jgi:DNA-binding MarR family transcriptional regulator
VVARRAAVELQQQPPDGLLDSPGFLLGKAAQRAGELAEAALQPFGLKVRHYGVLVTLRQFGGMSQQELGARLQIDRTTMVAVVDELSRRGLVEREADPDDRRAHVVRITGVGYHTLVEAAVGMTKADDSLLVRLTPEQRAQVSDVLLRLLGFDPPPHETLEGL